MGPAGIGWLAGTVTLTNTGTRSVSLVAAEPAVAVTRDGVVVATPLPADSVGHVLDLEPGAGRVLAAAAGLVGCATGTPLPPGPYDLWAAVALSGDGLPEGAAVVGGPWRVEVLVA
jgi:hypothetical protein